ncbi:tyrosine-protein kinase STYK1 isoform X2 [Lampris incognitus]|uniref:tyrosine-protein kinase STYK1 isoform X2 n=1 Tax=Lampris incognitus TaxID=2546036 RepID=UPI0024B59741|nr:tyrosine-protein kinase STYK1 isoform X2 [Lampris incognitus]
MDVQKTCGNTTSNPMCDEEASGPLAEIIIPSLLALSTVVVVALIFCSLLRNRITAPVSAPAHGQRSVSLSADSKVCPEAQEALQPWQLPAEYALEGLQFWQSGRYGPICNGRLKKEGTSQAVVVKLLRDGPDQPEAKEFMEWVLFHATVCKHEKVVRMLYCQTQRRPMYMVLEACSPGNLLHFLWTLRNDYLMSEHRLVHGDVAARNILMGPGLSARVSGLCVAFAGRRAGSAARRRAAEAPLKWQAPERLLKQPAIDRSDVWSFGILLYEMITLGSPPYPELEPSSLLSYLQSSHRMARPENCGGPLYDLMKYCWAWSFKDRPAFSAIVKLLESYMYLAATNALRVPDAMDVFDYNKRAGLHP